jgi:hypothetical protein
MRLLVVNKVSLIALAALPLTPAYLVSKPAAFSLTQSLRALEEIMASSAMATARLAGERGTAKADCNGASSYMHPLWPYRDQVLADHHQAGR